MTREKLFDTMETATFPHIRLARIWAQDEMWTQRAKGLSRADQRAWVEAHANHARAFLRKRLKDERRAAENEREHAREVEGIREQLRGFPTWENRRALETRLHAILTGRAA